MVSAFRQARSARSVAKGLFNVYWTSTRAGDRAVTCIREPCSTEDASARFFLHQLTAAGQRPVGDDAGLDMDFNFDSRGVMNDNRCVAVAPVPPDVPHVRTGRQRRVHLRGPLGLTTPTACHQHCWQRICWKLAMRKAGGNWVVGDRFFDRESELEALGDRVQEGTHTLLTAQRRMGKTSLVRELLRRLKDNGRCSATKRIESLSRC